MEVGSEENIETVDSTPSITLNRQNRSEVWTVFEKFKGQDGKEKARCIYCNREYLSESYYGTSNMRRHMLSCRKRPREGGEEGQHSKKVDQAVYREKLAEAVFLHGYAFMWAEHKGDRAIHSYLNDSIKPICRNTMKAECLKLHKKHMDRVKSIFESIPGRVCLTTDLWTSWNTEGYLCLTAHYIDVDWKLSSKILNFRHVPPPHSATVLCDTIHDLLKEWGIDRKVFSITMDNALNMDNMQEKLRYRLSAAHNSLVCGGDFFHIRCCAHILNLVVQAGIKVIAKSVEKVRESVKYVKASEARKMKFRECVEHAGIKSSKGLWLDVSTRWNSTFHMLERAIFYRPAFESLSAMDNNYVHYPTDYEWLRIREIHEILKPFYTITNLFSGRDYPTANLYFENVWKIQMMLSRLIDSPSMDIQEMVVEMRAKFDKYWSEYCCVLSFGVILDPRYKLIFLRYWFRKLHDEGKMDRIKFQFESMFKEYCGRMNRSTNPIRTEDISPAVPQESVDDSYSDFSSFGNEESNVEKTELDLYLAEPKKDHRLELDILEYWKERQERFPVLSAMARDILSIPITTVASESSFSIGGRILNRWRSRLLPENCEALITTRNWLYGYEAYDPEDEEASNVAGEEVHLAIPSEYVEPSSSHA